MASAVLTVLYPEEFTVYDYRVCDAIGGFHSLSNVSRFESLWDGYVEFRRTVEESAPVDLSLRDKDRHLWAKSFCEQLERDIQGRFTG